jgi:pimeloyl-ACP methyl ester carboxylesterase
MPSAGRLRVGFAVRTRSDRGEPSLGTIFAVEGGPGYAATDQPYASSLLAVLAPVLRRRDLVLVDARGTGTSGALYCDELQKGLVSEQIAVGQCAHRLGSRFADYTTAETVADIEQVRKRLGFGRIILYGDSYGTLQGQAYASRFETSLRALILDSAYPGTDPYYRTLFPAARHGLRVVCRRAPSCSGDPFARFTRVVRHLHAAGRPTENILQFLLEAGTLAPLSYLHLDEADRLYLAGHRRRLRRLINAVPPGNGPVHSFSYGLEVTVECNDYRVMWDKTASDEERRAQLAQAVTGLPRDYFSPFGRREYLLSEAAHLVTCLNWPQPPEGGLAPPIRPGYHASGRLPVLVLSGEVDDVTSTAEARQVARRFPRSRLYVVPNRGHASSLYYPFVSPATGVIRNFVRNH